MLASFSPVFSPDELRGWRGRQFSEREDCFQQLVGDALRETHDWAVHVSPTLGRDGSIDAWVEQASRDCALLGSLECPIIIECKDHEQKPDWSITWRNIRAGWSKVRDKLRDQADAGFVGKFEPWRRARSYVYCISATIHDQQARDELAREIRDFLQTVAPHIRDVIVLDWGALSFWLNTLPRVADNWLETGFPGITPHQAYVGGFTGFRRYLLNEHLAYEPPPPGGDMHPDALWKWLCEDDERRQPGLILYGAGGVGKSRLCIEVAELAYASGWRVLHVSPTEERLTERDLMSVVAAGARPTLLCFDYIDFMHGIDYIGIGGRLVRDAASRGVRLRYLANSRPMWALNAQCDPAALEVFSFRELGTTDEQLGRLLSRIIHTVAPRALEKCGQAALLRVCGRRPIIVLLIAREIEHRLDEGTLEDDEFEAARGGDLAVWLRKRLAGDQLKIQRPASFWEPSAPPDTMVAACGVLATAPNQRRTLVEAAAAVLSDLGSEADASFVVGQLVKMGWLEQDGPWLATPHDVVADEVFDQTVRDVDEIRARSLKAVLSVWTCEPSAIGRLATALRRWIGSQPPGLPAVEKVETAAAEWLCAHAHRIGALLASGDSDRTGFALGSILKGRPWSAVAVSTWDGLIAPWLAANERRPEARHVLYSGLRERSIAPRLVPHSIAWLESLGGGHDASYVLGPLLGLECLADAEAGVSIDRALAWLADFPLETETKFVLASLLGREDLREERAQTAIDGALAWLAKFPLQKGTGFVLPPLLGRDDLREAEAQTAIGTALDWLAKPPLEKGTRFVLAPLLGRDDLRKEKAQAAIDTALAWLATFPLEEETPFVLAPLLGRGDLPGEKAQTAIDRALAWLAKFPLERDTQFVLHRLLGRDDLRDEKAQTAIDRALAWLAKFPLEIETGFVLPPLLGRDDLREQKAQTGIDTALAWLAKFPLEKDTPFVLAPLLGCRDLGEAALGLTVRLALDWLPGFLATHDAEFVLKRLLPRPGLPIDRIGDLKQRAIQQLRDRVGDPNDQAASFLLRPWLHCEVRHPALDREIVGLASKWLRADPARTGADFVFNRILRQPDMPDADWLFAAGVAADWLSVPKRGHRDRDFAVNSLLKRPDLLPYDILAKTIQEGLRVLQSERNEKANLHLAPKLLRAVKHLPPGDPLVSSARSQIAKWVGAAAAGEGA